MLIRILYSFFYISLLSFVSFSQGGHYSGKRNLAKNLCKINQEYRSFASNKDADQALDRILSVTGMKNIILYPCSDIKNCVAVTYNGDRYILYDKKFMEDIANKSSSWSNLSILAHELGHHANGHTRDFILGQIGIKKDKNTIEKRRKEELEADEYSGFIMYKVGASLDEAQSAIKLYAPVKISRTSTHPAKADRLAAIEKGYKSAMINSGTVEKTNPNAIGYTIDDIVEVNDIIYNKKDMNPINGTVIEFHENKEFKSEFNYKDGLKNGTQKKWYENGQLKLNEIFLDGIYNGEQNEWYQNGQLKSKENFLNGISNGEQYSWDEFGEALRKLSYSEKGFIIGGWVIERKFSNYNCFGSIKFKIDPKYESTLCLKYEKYDSKGKLIKEASKAEYITKGNTNKKYDYSFPNYKTFQYDTNNWDKIVSLFSNNIIQKVEKFKDFEEYYEIYNDGELYSSNKILKNINEINYKWINGYGDTIIELSNCEEGIEEIRNYQNKTFTNYSFKCHSYNEKTCTVLNNSGDSSIIVIVNSQVDSYSENLLLDSKFDFDDSDHMFKLLITKNKNPLYVDTTLDVIKLGKNDLDEDVYLQKRIKKEWYNNGQLKSKTNYLNFTNNKDELFKDPEWEYLNKGHYHEVNYGVSDEYFENGEIKRRIIFPEIDELIKNLSLNSGWKWSYVDGLIK